MSTSSRDTLSTGTQKEASDSQFSQEALAITGPQNFQVRVLGDALQQKPRWYHQRRKLLVAVGLITFFVFVLAVFLPIFFIVVRKKPATTLTSPASGPGGGGNVNRNSSSEEVVSSCSGLLLPQLNFLLIFEDWGRWVCDYACQWNHLRIQ